MKKLLLSFFSALLLFTLSAQIVETFADYTVGGKLAQQAHAMGRTYWTTWSEAPGGAEDAVIGNIAGKKAVHLTYNNDQVLLLGNKTFGVWELSFKCYVPAGKDGYFNVKSVFPSTVSETWAIQVYLGTDEGTPGPSTPGLGTVYAGSSIGTIFPFAHDTWMPVKIFIDLDNDNAEFYINETLIQTWVYSTGSFGQSSHKYIAGMNIFPPNSTATSDFYVTDISFGMQFNFDDKANGALVGASYPNFWTPFLGLPGEDPAISNEQSSSAPHSVKLIPDNDLVFKIGNKTTGVYTVDFDMYIENNAPAYFNLLHLFDGYDSNWAVGVYFNVTTTGGPQAGTYVQQNAGITNFTAPNNQWFPISIFVDVDNDIANISINGTQILEWQFSLVENPSYGDSPMHQLSAMDFFPPEPGSKFYIDNFKFCVPRVVEESGNLFETGFDDVPNNSYVAASYPDWFTTWDNNPGTAEDALITNEKYETAPQSAKFDDGTDLVFKAGNKTEGIYAIEFDMYIPDAAPAFFNLLHKFEGNGSEWAMGAYFNIPSGAGMPVGTCIQVNNKTTTFTAPSNKWFPVAMFVDLDHDIAAISIDGTTILAWQFSIKESGGAGLKQLAAADFYPPTANSVYYIDNFVYREADQQSLPIISVTPTSITETVVEGEDETVTVPITVANTGTGQGSFEAKAADVDWLSLTGDTQGAVTVGGSKIFNAVIDATELEEGNYEAVIFVSTTYQDIEIIVKLNKKLGIEDYTITTIFPNPASDVVNVNCNTMINSIQIINNNGQVVYSNNVNNDKTTIDTSNLSAGYYFIRVITNEGTSSTKLIVK